jgi:fructan beta-fructosidase
MPVAGDPETHKWVLMTSVTRHGSMDDPGTQYMVGNFDGTTFAVDGPAGSYAWLDYGRDNYAGITFTDVPAEDGRRIHIGWMGNWATAFEVPTSPWRGAMTVPRELILATARGGGYRLLSRPVRELRALRGRYRHVEDRPLSDAQGVTLDGIAGGAFEVRLAVELGTAAAVKVRVGNGQGEWTVIGYDGRARTLTVDRRGSGGTAYGTDHGAGPYFADRVQSAPLARAAGTIELDLYVDWSSVEVYADGGAAVISDCIYPSRPYDRIACEATSGTARLVAGEVWELRSIWRGDG